MCCSRSLHTIAADDMSRQTPCTRVRRGAADRPSAELDHRHRRHGRRGHSRDQRQPTRRSSASSSARPAGPGRLAPPRPGRQRAGRQKRDARRGSVPASCRSNSWSTPGITRGPSATTSTPRIRWPNTCWTGPGDHPSRSSAAEPGSTTRSTCRGRCRAGQADRIHRPRSGPASRRPHRVCVQGFECAFRARFRADSRR